MNEGQREAALSSIVLARTELDLTCGCSTNHAIPARCSPPTSTAVSSAPQSFPYA